MIIFSARTTVIWVKIAIFIYFGENIFKIEHRLPVAYLEADYDVVLIENKSLKSQPWSEFRLKIVVLYEMDRWHTRF
jgi:hypothetical protein